MEKPWYKTWRVWVIVVGVLIIIGAVYIGNKKEANDTVNASATVQKPDGPTDETSTSEPTVKPTIKPTIEPTPIPTPLPTIAAITYEAELGSGNYTAGIDFPAGKYDIEAVSGGGNVTCDNLNGGINAIMGTEDLNDMFDMYEQKYSNIYLPQGTILSVSGGLVIHISSDSASGEPLTPRNQSITETITLGNGNFVAGEDFPSGVYNVVVVEGNGNVSSDNLFNGGINAIMGVRNNSVYAKEYKNVEFSDGVMLSINGVTIQLVPSI